MFNSSVKFCTLFFLFLLWNDGKNDVFAANILAIFPIPSHSHYVLGSRILKELAGRGHTITSISPYPQKTPIENFRDINIASNLGQITDMKKSFFDRETHGTIESILHLYNLGYVVTEQFLSHPEVQKLLRSKKEKFDLIIMEYFLNEADLALAQHFNAPIILQSTLQTSIFNNYLFANPGPSSYTPHILSPFTTSMTAYERLLNGFYNIFDALYKHLVMLPRHEALAKKYISSNIDLYGSLYNASLLLVNSHASIGAAMPHVKNIIEIGGFHVSAAPQKLPKDLQELMDNSKQNGVVLFSMGSNLNTSDLPPSKLNAILGAFSKIKATVLWKWESEELLTDKPANVKLIKWLPQQDLLAHPNMKAFITHGGLLSTIETVYHGVPVIGIPIFGDQKMNINTAAHNGYALVVPFKELTEERLSWALNEILNNPKYKENVKKRSVIMHDQPNKPLDSAIFWIEYVLRHKGAAHLRSPGMNLTWWQINMLEIIIVLTLITVILFVIFYFIFKHIIHKKITIDCKKKVE